MATEHAYVNVKEDYLFKTGKHKGKLVKQVLSEDPKYLLYRHSRLPWFCLSDHIYRQAQLKVRGY